MWLVFLFAAPVATAAQAQLAARIAGTVTDTTGAPLENINVFVASSMQGTVTDGNGRFEIGGLPLGSLRLYVSAVGYEAQHEDIFLREARTHVRDFALVPSTYQIGEITVTADNRRWRRQFERFTRIFIGESPYASQTTITNSGVLDFTAKGGEFRAQASEPLIIENKALGYRLTYFLNEFVAEPTSWRWDGEPLYEPLEPESPEQAALWNARRDSAFYGSFRHFLLAVINDQVNEQGFEMYSRPASGPGRQGAGVGRGSPLSNNQRFPIRANEILKPGESENERILDFEGFVDVVYTRELEERAYLALQQPPRRRPRFQTSPVKLDRGPTIIDLKGDTLDPYGVTFYGGYFGYERIANQLPREYRPWHE